MRRIGSDLESGHDRAFRHRDAFLDQDFNYPAGFRRCDRDFHLHRFEDEDRLVLLKGLAGFGNDLLDISGDFGLDIDNCHLRFLLRLRQAS